MVCTRSNGKGKSKSKSFVKESAKDFALAAQEAEEESLLNLEGQQF